LRAKQNLPRAPDEVWQATRARVSTEGFGARLLALQDPDGQWDGGAFFPGDFDFDGPAVQGRRQPGTATTWSLNALREWGVDAAALVGPSARFTVVRRPRCARPNQRCTPNLRYAQAG